MSVEIRMLTTLSDMALAVNLQRAYWGNTIESVVPGQMLFSLLNAGGHVIAAFNDDQIVGVLIGLLGADGTPAREHLKIYSKRMVVLPEFRGQGIAESLKLKQANLTREQGIETIRWTFDPLLSLNAHFNIRKLGSICNQYVVDYYGRDGDAYGLSILGMSDRWITDWHVNTEAVKERAVGNYKLTNFDKYVNNEDTLVYQAGFRNGILYPKSGLPGSDAEAVLVEIPADYKMLVEASPDLAKSWRLYTREVFTYLVNQELYEVVDFVKTTIDDHQHMFYVLQR